MGKPKFAKVKVDATLELEPGCLEYLDDVSMDELMQKVYEISDTIVRVKFGRGSRIYRGQIRFGTPNPPELKSAREEYLEKV